MERRFPKSAFLIPFPPCFSFPLPSYFPFPFFSLLGERGEYQEHNSFPPTMDSLSLPLFGLLLSSPAPEI